MDDPTGTSEQTGAAEAAPVAVPTQTGAAKPAPIAVTTEAVLCAEYHWLWPAEAPPVGEAQFYERISNKKLAALCLSGGGIRSAAFALGVLQSLSRKKILTGFHYLSTVSGGGYIGSFVQRWISEAPCGADEVMAALPATVEPRRIKRLRENSNFITPKVGLGSNDTWTAIAMSLRNIIINWFLFFPLFMLVAVLPNLFLSSVVSVPAAVRGTPWFDDALLGIAGLCIAVSIAFTITKLPSYSSKSGVHPTKADGWILTRIVTPIILWSIAGTLAIAPELLDVVDKARGASLSELGGFDLARTTFVGMVAGLVVGAALIKPEHRATLIKDIVVWPMSFLIASGWVLLGVSLFDNLTAAAGAGSLAPAFLTVIGPLWLLAATMMAAIFFVAFRWAEGPMVKPDADREWIARVSGVKFKPMIGWALAGFSALSLTMLLKPWIGEDPSIPSIIALLAGSGAVAGGRGESSGNVVSSGAALVKRFLPMQVIVALCTFIFAVALFVVLGGLEQSLATLLAGRVEKLLDSLGAPQWVDDMVVSHAVLLVAFALLVAILGRLIPVNRFSLNGLYRNRLARAFLGAARDDRKPNPFTGFDSYDNVRMHLLRPPDEPSEKCRALYPVINCALNVTATENLAWQERKAEPFIFSPLFSGSGMLDIKGAEAGSRGGAYVSSGVYGGSESDLALGETTGVTLATAMSISGAAASPNMGYHSSPATAFLMTLFNVRLGAWLPNPARADDLGTDMTRSSPKNSLRPLLAELGGSTDDLGHDVYLSDGGHFENLGLYEMLRRRCQYIVVSDAGADPACAYEDLGNAVRKAKIDLDCVVDFGRMCISSRDKAIIPQLAWAVGTATYKNGRTGTILYLKPSYFGEALPVDIVSYARKSLTFPHESTGDQWFSESQFESYRKLGEFFTDGLGHHSFAEQSDSHLDPLVAFFARADRQYRDELEKFDELEKSGFIEWLKKRVLP
jgi:hypothetical protein